MYSLLRNMSQKLLRDILQEKYFTKYSKPIHSLPILIRSHKVNFLLDQATLIQVGCTLLQLTLPKDICFTILNHIDYLDKKLSNIFADVL